MGFSLLNICDVCRCFYDANHAVNDEQLLCLYAAEETRQLLADRRRGLEPRDVNESLLKEQMLTDGSLLDVFA